MMGLEFLQRRFIGRLVERGPAGQELKERAAQAVDVCADVGLVRVLGLFRGHVVQRAQGMARAGHRAGRLFRFEAGQPQVQQLHLAGGAEHQVRGLHVPVDQAGLVRALEAQGCLAHHLAGIGHRQRPGMAQHLLEVHPIDQLHDQETRALDFPGVQGLDDVRMVQSSDGLHLAFESGHGALIGQSSGGQHFERHLAPQARVAGLVHGAHAALAQLVEQLVVAQLNWLRPTRLRTAGMDSARWPGRTERGRRRRDGGACARRRWGRLGRRGLERGAQLPVVGRLLFLIEQAHARASHLVEQALRVGRVRPGLERAQVAHALVRGMGDHVRIGFEQLDAQEPIVVGRLLIGRNAQPDVIWIERIGHAHHVPRRVHTDV